MDIPADLENRSPLKFTHHHTKGTPHGRHEQNLGASTGTVACPQTSAGQDQNRADPAISGTGATSGNRKFPRRRARLGSHHFDERRAGRGLARHRRTRTGATLQPGNGASPAVRNGFVRGGQVGGGGLQQAGAAVVDFVLVGALVTVFFVALIQLALVLHVRNTVADAASSAARYGALGDRTADDARERASLLVSTALGPHYVQDVTVSVQTQNGLQVLSVSISAPLPLVGLFGPARTLEMMGHAVISK